MTAAATGTVPTTRASDDRRAASAPTGLSLAAAAYVLGVVMIGTTMPTPLYPQYEAAFGFGSTVVTQLFAVYAVGVIATLVVLGRFSDIVGRRPLLLAGLVLSILSAVVFLVADIEWMLFAGRILSGFAAGIMTATGTVVVMENAPRGRERLAGALATASNIGGLALGMLMAGLVSQAASDSVRSPFVAHIVLLVVGIGALWFVRERGGRGGRLRLQLPRVPAQARGAFAVAAIGAVIGFAVCGVYSSLAPLFLSEILDVSAPAAIGFATFLLFGSSAVAQVLLRSRSARMLVLLGAIGLIVGMIGLAGALLSSSFLVLLLSSVLAGAGQGLLFTAGMRTATGAAPAEDRTQVTTSYFVIAYLSISVPAIIAGALTSAFGLVGVGVGFAAIIVVASAATLFTLRSYPAS